LTCDKKIPQNRRPSISHELSGSTVEQTGIKKPG